MGQRRKARECALQILYQLDAQYELGGEQLLTTMAEPIRLFWEEFNGDDEVRAFAEKLVRGVLRERPGLDELIQRFSRNWRLERMARVDRNVLRLACYELVHVPEIPKRVTLNEAIELAKRFGSEDSGAFINGVLDRICQDVDKP